MPEEILAEDDEAQRSSGEELGHQLAEQRRALARLEPAGEEDDGFRGPRSDRRAQVERRGAVGRREVDAVGHADNRLPEPKAVRHFPRQEVRARGRRRGMAEAATLEPRAEPAIAGSRVVERHDELGRRVKSHHLALLPPAVEEDPLAAALGDFDQIELPGGPRPG